MKYLKWVYQKKSTFEIGKVTTCDKWDPNNTDWEERGGFNFTNEECALRWMSRGDTLYEVEIPEDGEMLEVRNDKTPGGIMVSNKIILKNPIPISEELLEEYYHKSKLPLSTYYECIGILATRGYYDLALQIIKEKVDMEHIDLAIEKMDRAIKPNREIDYDCFHKVKEVLEEIKSPVDMNLFIDKEPYKKEFTKDPIINLTGQSGSGKSTYALENYQSDSYVVIDTDDIFSEERFEKSTGMNRELGEYFRQKYKELPNCGENFDEIYQDILDYCHDIDQTIVIDCAQFHCIKDINLLKGTLIVLRTCIDHCYERTIKRYQSLHKNIRKEELEKYKERKKALYTWYKYSNEFLEKVDQMKK